MSKRKKEVIAVLLKEGRADLANIVAATEVVSDKVDPALLKQVQKMTDRNDHTEARIFVAEKVLKDKKLAKMYRAVDEIASIMGEMPSQLGDFRYYVLDKQYLQKQLEQKGLGAYWGAM